MPAKIPLDKRESCVFHSLNMDDNAGKKKKKLDQRESYVFHHPWNWIFSYLFCSAIPPFPNPMVGSLTKEEQNKGERKKTCGPNG